MPTSVLTATGVVVTGKVALVAPAATVTDDGTVAIAVEELSDTTFPLEGALLDKKTVPVELNPPATDVGETLSFAKTWAEDSEKLQYSNARASKGLVRI